MTRTIQFLLGIFFEKDRFMYKHWEHGVIHTIYGYHCDKCKKVWPEHI